MIIRITSGSAGSFARIRMKNISNIELAYDPKLVTLLKLGDKELLKSNDWDKAAFELCIHETSTYFPVLEKHPILLFFTYRSSKTLANFHPSFCQIDDFGNSDIAELRNKRPELFIINYWRHIFSLDEIGQILNYSHEFQHVVQYVTNKKYYLFSRILSHLVESIQEENLPTEIDAERASKRILETIYGKQKIEDWINKQLEEIPCSFFIRFGKLDVDVEYDIKKKAKELWDRNQLDEAIDEMRNKKDKSETQKRILKMYDDALTGLMK